MENFLVSVQPNGQQLYLNAVLQNNSSLEHAEFLEHKKVLFSDKVPNEIISSILKDPRVSDRSKDAMSPVGCWSNTIQICLHEMEMEYDRMNGGIDYLKENYNNNELSDYSIIEFIRTDFFKGKHIERGEVLLAHVTIRIKNLLGNIIQFDSHNIIDFEWNNWVNFIKEINEMISRQAEIERDEFGFFQYEDYSDLY